MTIAQHIRRGGAAVLLATMAALTAGCEEDVNVVLGSDRPYTLYGVFSPDLDTQWVRVFPIEPRLEAREPEALDAAVTSRDLLTGEVRVWQDSLLEERDGYYEHVFWSPFTAEYGHPYEFTVERSDGARSRVAVTVPPAAEIQPREASVSPPFITIPVLVAGDVPRIFKVEVVYVIDYLPKDPEVGTEVVISYDGLQKREAGGWLVSIRLGDDYDAIRQWLTSQVAIQPDYGIQLSSMRLRLVAGNEAWAPPGGAFDPEVLVQPGTMNNVENGFGFVGAGYRLSAAWVPSDEAKQAAGFKVPPPLEE